MRNHKVLGVMDGKGSPLILANLRDLAAIAAMQGILAFPDGTIEIKPKQLASISVECADAPLAELEKQP